MFQVLGLSQNLPKDPILKKTLFPNAELNLLSPGSGCHLQAGTGMCDQDGIRADADAW
jgi:hypothetical protein